MFENLLGYFNQLVINVCTSDAVRFMLNNAEAITLAFCYYSLH